MLELSMLCSARAPLRRSRAGCHVPWASMASAWAWVLCQWVAWEGCTQKPCVSTAGWGGSCASEARACCGWAWVELWC